DATTPDAAPPPPSEPPAEARRRRAAVGHAVSFWTWWSLGHEQGLSDPEAIEIMLSAVLG
ncbi:MAG TPA: hypothetical protein VH442_20610, partial [Micromonosporaceae bacterium]